MKLHVLQWNEIKLISSSAAPGFQISRSSEPLPGKEQRFGGRVPHTGMQKRLRPYASENSVLIADERCGQKNMFERGKVGKPE